MVSAYGELYKGKSWLYYSFSRSGVLRMMLVIGKGGSMERSDEFQNARYYVKVF